MKHNEKLLNLFLKFHLTLSLFKLLQRKLRRPTFLCFSSQINIPHAYYLCSLLVFTWMVLGKKFCNVYQGHFRFGDFPDLICYRKQEIILFLHHHNNMYLCQKYCFLQVKLFYGGLASSEKSQKWYFVSKIVLNNLLSEKRLKFQAEGRFPFNNLFEQYNFLYRFSFNFFLEVSQI